jgi:hypothetical protein
MPTMTSICQPVAVRAAERRPALPAGELAATRSTTTPSTPRRRATASSRMLTPRPTRVGRPLAMICGTTRSMTVCGTAKPMPAEEPLALKIIVFMPMSWPRLSSSGPPELPGLMAASVCTISRMVTPPMPLTSRPIAETTPVVSVWSRPKGLPMAMVFWPTTSAYFSGTRRMGTSGSVGLISRTAMSLKGSAPTSVAS